MGIVAVAVLAVVVASGPSPVVVVSGRVGALAEATTVAGKPTKLGAPRN
jgi:hypothetical protein